MCACRPVAVITRIAQLMSISGSFLSSLLIDLLRGRLKETEVARAIQLRNIVTSLGPAYIKLGQALSIRPDILSPAAMNELQKLCDKVPSFDSAIAMQVRGTPAPWCSAAPSSSGRNSSSNGNSSSGAGAAVGVLVGASLNMQSTAGPPTRLIPALLTHR
jgi:hypothetical protein